MRKAELAHVLWIGGGTDAGKTTIAQALVERHQLQFYHFDRHERSHIERMIAAGDSVRYATRDPVLATENIIALDLLMAQHVRAEATRLGLTLIEVDGAQSIEQLMTCVEQHFAPFLQARSIEKE